MSRQPAREVSPTPIKLLLVNLPLMVSQLLHKVLEDIDDMELVNPSVRTASILTIPQLASIDVVLIGSDGPDCIANTVKILEGLRQRYSRIRILVLAGEPQYIETIALFRAGAHGIISEADVQFDLLCKSIRCVHNGEVWANNKLLKHLVASLGPPQSRNLTDSRGKRLLTDREQQVLDLLADGLSNTQLAAQLKVSEHTVKNHLFRIYEKLGVSNRTEAVLYALSPRPGTA